MNVFLTGDVQVGKSTAIRRFLEENNISVCGFRTCLNRENYQLNMEIIGKQGSENLLVAERKTEGGPPVPDLAAFDEGGRLLGEMDLTGASMLLMDELGYMERNALEFRGAVAELLDSGIPVVGVLRNKPEGPFWEMIHEHPETVLLTVTRENRDEMPRIVASYFPELTGRKAGA
ncbi:MAG: nucleoside-triphosphatase [Anaerovoracaceae bacterium]